MFDISLFTEQDRKDLMLRTNLFKEVALPEEVEAGLLHVLLGVLDEVLRGHAKLFHDDVTRRREAEALN